MEKTERLPLRGLIRLKQSLDMRAVPRFGRTVRLRRENLRRLRDDLVLKGFLPLRALEKHPEMLCGGVLLGLRVQSAQSA